MGKELKKDSEYIRSESNYIRYNAYMYKKEDFWRY